MNEISVINQKFTQIYETSELILQKQNRIWTTINQILEVQDI